MAYEDKEWYQAQGRVQAWLGNHGIQTRRAGYFAPFDLYTQNGTRIEVKNAPLRKAGEYWLWAFNIHRHGKVNKENVDFYVLRLESCEPLEMYGFTNAIHLVLPASQTDGLTVSITPRSLLANAKEYSAWLENAESILTFDATCQNSQTVESQSNARPTWKPGQKKRGRPKRITS